MSRPRGGIFFDLDGTLADSLPAMRQVLADFLGRFGVRAAPGEFETLNGPSLTEIVDRLKIHHRLPQPEDELLALYRRLIDRSYRERVELSPGAATALARLKGRGYLLALVSAASRSLAEAFVERHLPPGTFDLLACGDEVAAGKPAPDLYRLALKRSGLAPDQCLAVEDSISGVRSATRAGIVVIGLAPDGHQEVLLKAGARAVAGHFDHLPDLVSGLLC